MYMKYIMPINKRQVNENSKAKLASNIYHKHIINTDVLHTVSNSIDVTEPAF